MLGNGSRQIMRFHFQGDILGLPLLAFAESPETVTAVTDVDPLPVQPRAAGGDHQRASAASPPCCSGSPSRTGSSLADRLASIGRTSARARVSSLLCEMFARMRRLGTPHDDPLHLPLTQEEIGDATGLTAVHVNRMMRGIVEDGLIERNGSHIRLLDEKRLAAEANYIDRTGIETGWLPQPR